jgi:hypothetical protein
VETAAGEQQHPHESEPELVEPPGEARPRIVLGVVVAPGLARDVTTGIADDLLEDLGRRYGAVDWQTQLVVDRLVSPPAAITEIVDEARRRLLERDWDLGVVVTDLPLRVAGRPISRHVSPTHGIALISLPALGAIQLRRRLRRTLLDLVGDLVGDSGEPRGGGSRWARLRRRWERHLLWELATDTDHRPGGIAILFVPAVLVGNLRLLLGMVRANRPWRLSLRLYRALVAATAVGAFGVVQSDVWRLSSAAGRPRLAIMSVASVIVTIVAVILVHELWERAPDPRVREQVVLFNIATAATVAIGILSLYIALFVAILAGAALVVSPAVLSDALGEAVGALDYAVLAWFTASLATVGGALGAGLESDEAVREAAYAASVGGDEEAKEIVEP